MSLDKPSGTGDQQPDKPVTGQSGATETKPPPSRAETRSEAEHARDVMSRPPVRRYEDGATDPPRPARTDRHHTAQGDTDRSSSVDSRPAPAEPRSEAEHARDVMSRPPVRRPWLETPDAQDSPRRADVPAAAEPARGQHGPEERVPAGETIGRARPDTDSVADGPVRVRVAEPAERVRPNGEDRPPVPDGPGRADGGDGPSGKRPASAEDGRGGRDAKNARPEDDEEAAGTSEERQTGRDRAAEQDQTAGPARERPQPPEAPEAHPDAGRDMVDEQPWAVFERRMQAAIDGMKADYLAKLDSLKIEHEEDKARLEQKISELNTEVEALRAERKPSADESPDNGDRAPHTGPPDVIGPEEHRDLQSPGTAADMDPIDRRAMTESGIEGHKTPAKAERQVFTAENITAAGAGFVLVQSVGTVIGNVPPEVGVGASAVVFVGAAMTTTLVKNIMKKRKG